MPSYLHELLLELFRNRSRSAADLLRELHVELPEFDRIHAESVDINDLEPAEYRADLVLFLARGATDVLGVIVEVQLGRDEDKPYAWPAYISNLRARHRCPVCLLVVTIEDHVARWAASPIELGPGTRCQPWVVGPSNAPVVTGLEHARENVELAVLSAIEHAHHPDAALADRIASSAISALQAIDAEHAKLYFDLLQTSATASAPETQGNPMNILGFEYQSDFARRYVAQGKAEGRMEFTLQLLASRFGPLPEEIQTSVRGANDAQLYAVAERILTAQTLEEALGPMKV